MQYAKGLLKLLIEVFGTGGNIEEAWVDSDVSATPREKLIRQTSKVMQWAAFGPASLRPVTGRPHG